MCKRLTPNVLTVDKSGPVGTGDPFTEGLGRLSLYSGDAKDSEVLNTDSLMRKGMESSFWETLPSACHSRNVKHVRTCDVHTR